VPLRLRDGTPVWLTSTEPAGAGDERAEIVATGVDARVIGRVAYRRVYGPRAVLTLAVDDELSPLGLPEALIASAGLAAAAGGISTFMIRVPTAEYPLLALLVARFGARCTCEPSFVDAELATVSRVAENYRLGLAVGTDVSQSAPDDA
jgi:hypothetical protein